MRSAISLLIILVLTGLSILAVIASAFSFWLTATIIFVTAIIITVITSLVGHFLNDTFYLWWLSNHNTVSVAEVLLVSLSLIGIAIGLNGLITSMFCVTIVVIVFIMSYVVAYLPSGSKLLEKTDILIIAVLNLILLIELIIISVQIQNGLAQTLCLIIGIVALGLKSYTMLDQLKNAKK